MKALLIKLLLIIFIGYSSWASAQGKSNNRLFSVSGCNNLPKIEYWSNLKESSPTSFFDKIDSSTILEPTFNSMMQTKINLFNPRQTAQLMKFQNSNFWVGKNTNQISWKNITISGIGVGYGVLALYNHSLVTLNRSTRNEIKEDHPYFSTHIDNYLQFSPAVALIGLNLLDIKGKNTIINETYTYGISSFLLLGIVQGTKHFVKEQRPDGSAFNSFPSGHTATAFAAAELLRTEYWDRSPWIGIAGYAAATSVGILRVYNNRHWASDVLAGAAIGFLSTRVAYAVTPWIKIHVLHHIKNKSQLSSY